MKFACPMRSGIALSVPALPVALEGRRELVGWLASDYDSRDNSLVPTLQSTLGASRAHKRAFRNAEWARNIPFHSEFLIPGSIASKIMPSAN